MDSNLQQVLEKNHRSSSETSLELVAAAFTVRVRHNVPLFSDEAAVKKIEGILLAEALGSGSDIVVYLFMPDHCHVLLQGSMGQARLQDAMKSVRRLAGYWLSKIQRNAEWQEDFDNDILMKEQEILRHVRYILNNPVRGGMVDDWKSYRYRGSTLYNLDSWS
jgi:putative transposase